MAEQPGTPFYEVGISGVPRYGAVSPVYDEFFRELQGRNGMKLYREAIDNNAIIGAFLFALQHLSRNVTYRVVPSSDPKANPMLAQKVAERVSAAIFEDLDHTWEDTVSEILSMVPYGWAVCEMTYKRCLGMNPPQPTTPFDAGPLLAGTGGQGVDEPVFTPSKFNDGWLGWKSWGLRAQDTLFMWEFDVNSRAQVMQQMAPPDYRVRRIPLSKCLHFRASVNKSSPEGRSVIRNAIPSYLYVKNIQNIEAIGAERDLAGYPVFQLKPPDPTKDQRPPDLFNKNKADMVALLSTIERMVRQIRNDEQSGLVLPWWLDFKLLTSGGRRNFDTSTIIDRYDQRISMVVLADFILIGHGSTGSKALASTKTSLFTTALNSFLGSIAAIINRFAIPQLMTLNGVPQELWPKFEHGDAEDVPLDVLGTYLQQLSTAGMPLFPNADLERALLAAARLPESGITDASDVLTESGDAIGESNDAGGDDEVIPAAAAPHATPPPAGGAPGATPAVPPRANPALVKALVKALRAEQATRAAKARKIFAITRPSA